MNIRSRFTQSVLTAMRRDVQEAKGNEVFWAGVINADGKVIDVKVGSRGNVNSVIVNPDTVRQGHVLIHNHPSGNLEPSANDQSIATNSADTSLGFYIVNNEVTDVYVVVEPVKPKVLVPLKESDVAFYLSAGGPLSKQSESFEERPSQIKLLCSIARTFNEGKIGVFEAGTGVGKSYAYLIPSMLWAIQNKERVIISTGTINLQQQLIEKDIPFAQKIIGKNIKSILLKGRQNYVCLRRLAEVSSDVDLLNKDLFTEDAETFNKIIDWAKSSPSGSKTDLSFVPPESVWSQINSESDACMGGRCQYREECFVMKVRKEASDANIVVVNHHLLFADIESRMNGSGYEDAAVLPPYRHIVFDEAHGIEDSATSFFSEVITRFKVLKQLNLLYRTFRANMSGFLVQVAAVVDSEDFLENVYSKIQNIKSALIQLDEIALSVLDDNSDARITEVTAPHFESVFSMMDNLRHSLANFTGYIREVFETISDDDKDLPSIWESKNVLRRLESFVSLCKSFCEWNEHEDLVFYMQRITLPPKKQGDERITFVQFTQTPLDIAPLMNMGVFEPMSSVVCTSATLRTGTSFDYWMRRTGISFIDSSRVEQGVFDSPFNYLKKAIFAVVHDAPMPDNNFVFQSYIEDVIPKLIFAAGGRTLVLFTSFDSLKHAYNNSHSLLNDAGITALKQGDDDRFRLLRRFKEDTTSVLFATNSFWEGVDVPGKSLSQVIIVKLPFSVPSDPVFAARSESVEKRGGSAFFELSVPQAVIKFRQGFGRLLRRGDDKGVIVVLDRRIIEKNYGKQFTTSVPMTRRMYNPLEDITNAIKNFLDPL